MKEAFALRQITDWLSAQHIFWIRLNTGAFVLEGRFFKSHSLGRGCADILALKPAQNYFTPIWIEVKGQGEKGPPSRQSHEQKFFEQMVLELGHKYIVAYSIDDLLGVV